jgi:hypothetical protein
VNLEPDVLAKYVENILGLTTSHRDISRGFLKEHRFING